MSRSVRNPDYRRPEPEYRVEITGNIKVYIPVRPRP